MCKKHGFGLIELIVIIGVIAVISAIATPSVLAWRAKVKLRSAAQELRGCMQLARSRAIQAGQTVVVNLEDDSYFSFVDKGNGSGGPPDWSHNPPEPVICDRQLPPKTQLKRNVTPTGDPAPLTAPPGTAVHNQLVDSVNNAIALGIAGSLMEVDNFEERKLQFIPAAHAENQWKVFYDGETTGLMIGPPDIYPDQLVFDHKGRCLNPQFIIVVHVNGQKMLLEVTRFGIAKVTKIG